MTTTSTIDPHSVTHIQHTSQNSVPQTTLTERFQPIQPQPSKIMQENHLIRTPLTPNDGTTDYNNVSTMECLHSVVPT
jgi:hypothetical protein